MMLIIWYRDENGWRRIKYKETFILNAKVWGTILAAFTLAEMMGWVK